MILYKKATIFSRISDESGLIRNFLRNVRVRGKAIGCVRVNSGTFCTTCLTTYGIFIMAPPPEKAQVNLVKESVPFVPHDWRPENSKEIFFNEGRLAYFQRFSDRIRNMPL